MHKIVQKSDVSVTMEGIEQNPKKGSEHGKAAIYTLLGDVYDTNDAKGKDDNSALLEANDSDSSEDSDIQLFSGKNFYLNNGNPFEMYMQLLLSRGEMLKINSELKSYTELAQAGLTLNDDGTVSGDGSKGFANLIYNATIEAADQQVQQTKLQGAQELSSGISDLVSVSFTNALAGNADKEQNDVDKLENALSKLDTIKKAPEYIGDIDKNPNDEKALAINKLKNNEYDVTAEGQHFGSVEKTNGKKKSYTKETEENREAEEFKIPGTDVTVEEAYATAGDSGRSQIRKNFENKLDEAKKTLEKAVKGIDNKKQLVKTIIESAQRTASAGITFGKQAFIKGQAEAEAAKQKDQMLQQSLQSVEGSAGTAYKNSQDTLSSTLTELQGIMRNIRTGG